MYNLKPENIPDDRVTREDDTVTETLDDRRGNACMDNKKKTADCMYQNQKKKKNNK